jgi:hypothetical protein
LAGYRPSPGSSHCAIVIGGAFWAWLYHKSDSLASHLAQPRLASTPPSSPSAYQMLAAQRL